MSEHHDAGVATEPTRAERTPARYGPIPSLDGFRAFAVLLVVASHSGYGDIVPGGLGVTAFFFLSGYLITTLMLDEWGRSDTVDIPRFYGRRALRLLPPLVVTLVVAYSMLGIGWLGGGFSWGGLASQLFYFANYHAIFFETGGGRPDGTGILWSLAVEEHFYILFPLLMIVALRWAGARRLLIALFASLCVAALVWRWWLVSQPDFVELRTYYASDTRFDSILYGCLLAVWRNPARLPPTTTERRMTATDWLLFGGGVVLLLATIAYRDPTFRESLRYSLQGIALMPIFYYAIRFPRTGPFRLLNLPTLARLGVLSYGIYLSHDIILHMFPGTWDLDPPSWMRLVVALAGSIAFAAMIDRLVDPYFRRWRSALR